VCEVGAFNQWGPLKNGLFLNCWEDTRKAGENREDAGKFESGQMFANNQHGNQHGEDGFQTQEQ
jgi:hypothetical protein